MSAKLILLVPFHSDSIDPHTHGPIDAGFIDALKMLLKRAFGHD
jgi:hypothetical protein